MTQISGPGGWTSCWSNGWYKREHWDLQGLEPHCKTDELPASLHQRFTPSPAGWSLLRHKNKAAESCGRVFTWSG